MTSIDSLADEISLLDSMDTNLKFEVNWDMEDLTGVVTDWLITPASSRISMVGTLSSKHFSNMVGRHLDSNLANRSRMFLYAVSLAHVQVGNMSDSHYLSLPDLQNITCVLGRDLLGQLDRLVSPTELARATKERCEAIFLVLYGTLLAVSYSYCRGTWPTFPPDAMPGAGKTLWDAMREHLVQMLAHLLVFLSARLGVRFQPSVENSILSTTIPAWKQHGQYTWQIDVFVPDDTPKNAPGDSEIILPGRIPAWK